jgi:hypothetical protein
MTTESNNHEKNMRLLAKTTKRSKFTAVSILVNPLITVSNLVVFSLKKRSGFMSDENDVSQNYLSLELKLKFRYGHEEWVTLVLGKAERHHVSGANGI